MSSVKLKVRNALTGKRLAILVILIAAEAFLAPLKGILATGTWPTAIQCADAGATAILQAITLSVGVLEKV